MPSIEIENFYKQKIERDDYGAESVIKKLDKTKLCNYICDELSLYDQKIVFEKLNSEIDRIFKAVIKN